MKTTTFLQFTTAGAACVLIWGGEAVAQPRLFDIPPGELKGALDAYAKQAGVQLIYRTDAVRGTRTAGANGSLEPQAALQQLLANTGLAVHPGSNGAVAIARAQPDAPAFRLASAGPMTSPSAGTPSALAEVVVTARKREETLQKVPVSVSAMTTNDLQNRSITDLSSVSQSTPNFSFDESPTGGRAAGVVYIRGVGQSDTTPTYDPAVGIYLDGVYLGSMQGNDLDMLEIERVEVLRGPQGTLFGKNTEGGAINIVTKQPNLIDYSGRAQVTAGSRHRIDVTGGLNAPLVKDKVALQISASRRRQDGYGHRLLVGDDEGDTNRDSERAELLVAPIDDFRILLEADRTQLNETAAVMKLTNALTAGPPIEALNALYAMGLTPLPYDTRWVTSSDFTTDSTGPNLSLGDIWGTAATMTWALGGVTLKSISSYRHIETRDDFDPDGSPLTILNQLEHVQQQQASQEFQVTGISFNERLNWVTGLYYFHELANVATGYDVIDPLKPFGVNANFLLAQPIKNNSYAAYGQGTYDLTEKLRATVGLRYTKDNKAVVRDYLGFPDTSIVLQPTTEKSRDSQAWSPRFGLDYQWTPTFMTYVSAAQGYKGGGFNGRAATIADFTEFKDETVWTYEAGLRSELFDRRVRFNATAFYSDYHDMQVQIAGATTDPVTGNPVPFNVVTNIPRARIQGGEAELTIVPAKGLKLNAGLGLTYGKYETLPSDPQFLAAPPLTTRSQLANVPKATWTGAVEYTTALTPNVTVTANADYAYKTTIYFNTENTLAARQTPYGLLDARLTFEHDPSGISIAVFGKNLTNTHYAVGAYDDDQQDAPTLGFVFLDMAPPREWGVSLQAKF